MSEQARKEFERWMQHADGEILEELKRIEHDPEEIEKLLKGRLKGGKHIYTLGWPT